MHQSEGKKRAARKTPIVCPGDKPAYSPEGVDLTLIRWMLSLTPKERLLALQRTVDAFDKMRNARSEV
jgi:hypothetical protein